MESNRKTAIIAGVLFLTVLASTILSGSFSGSIDDPNDLIAVSADELQVLTGVLFMVILTASVVAIPIVMFPVLKRHSGRLALGYVGARIFEGLFDVVVFGIAPLLLLTLSLEFVVAGAPVDSYFQTSGALLIALRDWSSILENFPYGLGALILYLVLFQSELAPRWLSVWGLIGATLLLAMGLLRMFGKPAILLAIPLILNELVLAVWLIFVGFNSSAIASAIAGALFIAALVSTALNGAFTKSISGPDYLTVGSASENKVLIGVFFQVTLTASVVAISIVLFPILRVHHEVLALAYVGARIFEGVADAAIALSQLLLLTLSREFVKAEYPPTEATKAEME